jgi:GT2 family glycosyltransferase
MSQVKQQSSAPAKFESSRSVLRLFAIVVLYKVNPADSSSLQTLLTAATSVREGLELKILVWDNTPGGQSAGVFPPGVLYKSAPHNPGLAIAYNYAWKMADSEGYEWLLTLDQDSVLPANYLARAAELAHDLISTETVGAIVPQVIADGRVISPFEFLFGALPRWFPLGHVGLSKRAAYAANSGSILRIAALRGVDGYDPAFPLDLSDTSVFHRLYHSGKHVFIAGDLQLHHDFALLNKHARMSIERYDASLLDDCAFWDIYMSKLARLERVLRFAVRACKESFRSNDAPFRKRTLLEVKRRLFKSRLRRMTEWKTFAALRCDSIEQRASALGLTLEGTPKQLPSLAAGQREIVM